VIVFAALATIIVVALWIFINRLVRVPADDVIKTDGPFKIFTQLFSKSVSDTKENYQQQKESFSKSLPPSDESDLSETTYDETVPAADATVPETVTTP
jgi:hypothetical protein